MAFSAPGAASGGLSTQDAWSQQIFPVIHWIQAVMASLSVIGSSSLIGCAVLQNTGSSPQGRPLFYLSLLDLFLGMSWLFGALFYSEEAATSGSQEAACYNLQATGEIFYVASFLCTVNYTWHLYIDLKMKYNQNLQNRPPQILSYVNHIGRIAIVLSGAVPLLLMGPVFGLGNYYECYQNFTAEHGCLLMHTEVKFITGPHQYPCGVMFSYGIGVFFISFLASFIAILVLLIRARGLYKKFLNSTGYVGDQEWAMIKMVEQRVFLYPMIFFCCWGPAFILGIFRLTSLEHTRPYMGICVLEALTASSQGLLNCAVYCWTQHTFRCMKRRACQDGETQTPLLRSQKRFYESTLPAAGRQAQAKSAAGSTVL
ncbi:transmembrane protein 116 [Lacerta agilis]|uniref:transmembrane protein 116 n=1 Tax=Lacerta agilis TaxID=80427 RepID=UPI00141A1A58|nr:transmembrane protein 116 [Lacerta agilis]